MLITFYILTMIALGILTPLLKPAFAWNSSQI